MGQSRAIRATTTRALKQRAAAASIVASTILAALKLIAGLASGSLALLSEGAHNTIDIGASALTFFAVREADKPADADHPFGHAKIEAVAALAETGFLAALSIGVAIAGVMRIRGGGGAVEVNAFAIGAILLSIIVDVVRWRALTHVARLTSSHALSADALHYSSDLVASVFVLIGLAATRAGYPHADALAAIGVAGFIAAAGYRLGRATIDALVDRAPEGLTDAIREPGHQHGERRRDRGDPAPTQRPQDRGRCRRVGVAHPAAGTRSGGQGRASNPDRPTMA